MPEQGRHSLVLDVGKTNVKIHVLNERQESVVVHNMDNRVIDTAPYPHADVDGIWEWMLGTFSKVSRDFEIGAISISTHGATAALVDPATADGLVLPIVDYEWEGVANDGAYAAVRPKFSETFSPLLPAGLNLGRQLYWQQQNFPAEFARARHILMYPQYWAWRLTGRPVSEVSSLGCHTDLWAPEKNSWSNLVERQGWTKLFPPLASAWQPLGELSPELAEKATLPAGCIVHTGVHDSNASLLRFLKALPDRGFCLVSSGTWVVCMSTEGRFDVLDESRDMLANVSVEQKLIPCIRFMGGREYAEICKRFEVAPCDTASEADIARIIDVGSFALPDFSNGSGPFGGRKPEIRGKAASGNALATLYCALMVDYCLDLLQVKGDVIIAGSYLQNPLLCGLIAQLRGDQPVHLSSDTAGTVRGAAQLADWKRPVSVSLKKCEPSQVEGLVGYRDEWRKLAGEAV